MNIFHGLHAVGRAQACALTIGNFDGVHRGHQAMLALLVNEARRRDVASCVLTFEPHPRDYFAALHRNPDLAPARIGTLRDKLAELARCGVQQVVVLRFNQALAQLSVQSFIDEVVVRGLGARHVLVGDDFRFGAKRVGDHAMLVAAGRAHGFDVACMPSYEANGERVSSTAVRQALAAADMSAVQRLLGRPYAISGHVVRGRQLRRALGATRDGAGDGFRTLNLRFSHWKPAASGIFAVLVHGLAEQPLQGVANLGVRPSLDPHDVNAGRALLETHCLDWPAHLDAEGGYGKIIRVELLYKLHDELRYESLQALTDGIARDCDQARAYFATTYVQTRRQTTRDRI